MARIGRPARITRELLVEHGAALGLEHCTVRAVAERLGVSEMTIYRHVGDAPGLRRLVAEGIVAAAPLPLPTQADPERALLDLAARMREFIAEHPGIGAHLGSLSADDAESLRRIELVQAAYAERYGWPPDAASVLVSTVVEHAVATAELRAAAPPRRPDDAGLEGFPTIRAGAQLAARLVDDPLQWTTLAIIRGAASLLGLGLGPGPEAGTTALGAG